MKDDPFIPVNSRIPRPLWLDVRKGVFTKKNPNGEFANFSEALRHYIDLGVKAEAAIKEIENPEFVEEIKKLWDQTKHVDILNAMDSDTRKALGFYLDLVNKQKWEQRKFV